VDIEITYHSGEGEDWFGARLLSAKLIPRRYFNHVDYLAIFLDKCV
jgi:hypothetical protein